MEQLGIWSLKTTLYPNTENYNSGNTYKFPISVLDLSNIYAELGNFLKVKPEQYILKTVFSYMKTPVITTNPHL